MQIAVTGSSGLIGTALLAALRRAGHEAIPVVRPGQQRGGRRPALGPRARARSTRRASRGSTPSCTSPAPGSATSAGPPSRSSGSSRAGPAPPRCSPRRWPGSRRPPSVLVSGSAIGWYGDRGAEVLTEASPPPDRPDFLADVCRQWEAATAPAEAAGIRTVHVRTGIVLAPRGRGPPADAAAVPARPRRARSAPGEQYMSWIALDDEIGAIIHAITTRTSSGPLNATAPTPVTNAEFTAALGARAEATDVAPDAAPRVEARLRRRARGAPARRRASGSCPTGSRAPGTRSRTGIWSALRTMLG